VSSAIFVALTCESVPAASLTFPLQAKWNVALPGPPNYPPAYDADFAYLSLRGDQLVAVSLKDGTTAWSVECPMSAPPAAGDGFVFAGTDGFIEARAQKDGRTQWRRPIQSRVSSLYWDTGWLLATVEDGSLLALRAADGEIIWQRDFGARLYAPPVPAGDRLYLALTDGRLVAAWLKNGEEIWTRKLPEPGVGILPLPDRVYVGSLDNYFYCLDTKNGDVDWRWPTGADLRGVPVVDSRRVYFVALDNVLRAHDRKSGSMLWKQILPMRPSTGPLMSGNTLIVAGVATEMRAYNSVDGLPLPAGSFVLKGSQGEEMTLAAPPHLATEDLVVITTKGGQVQALTSGVPADTIVPAAGTAPAAASSPPPP
jgi:outer membrane protein assembly factor BamB